MSRTSPNDTLASETVDTRIVALMRLTLAASALLIIFIDPSEPDRFVSITYTVLALYVIYSACLCILSVRYTRLFTSIVRWTHVIDLAWYVLLIALSSGTSSIFFFFFFFTILVASFRWGFRSGLRVTTVAVILFSTIGYATAPKGHEFELNRFLLRPIYLWVLGYMMAYWGGFEITLKRRLALLKEVTLLSNPRFGVNRTIGLVLERLREFYDADACVMISGGSDAEPYVWRRAVPDDPEAAMHPQPIPAEFARRLLALPSEQAVVYSDLRKGWWQRTRYHAFDVVTDQHTDEGLDTVQGLAATLDTDSLVSVPLRYHHELQGRLYVLSRKRAFANSDASFLLQVLEHLAPIVDNIRLVDQLASDAAEAERQRIAHDLHDSVIQPYIGMQIGLGAIREELIAEGSRAVDDLEGIIAGIDDEIAELRHYLRGLKASGERGSILTPAVERFAAKFSDATGITVAVEAQSNLRCNDRLAAEVFQIVSEGLSNIRRHTQAIRATVRLKRVADHLLVSIENDGGDGSSTPAFTPRSISERVSALGGRTRVQQLPDGGTAVLVEIPL